MKKLVLSSLALLFASSVSASNASLWSTNGHWYEVVKVPSGISWESARDRAESLGGYLATPESMAENDFIKSLITTDSEYWNVKGIGPWIGGFQNESMETPNSEASDWYWLNGPSFTYTEWQNAQPDNGFMGADEGYLHYLAEDYTVASTIGWNDAANTPTKYSPMSFVVEYEIQPATAEMGQWIDVDLSDTQNFDVSCEYRSYGSAIGANYPVSVSSTKLLFDVSTAQFAFGVINSTNKTQYRYVKEGNVGGSQWNGWSVYKMQKRCEVN